MIIFKTIAWSWDLTNFGITFNEKSQFFSDKIEKNYTFPFSTLVNEDIAEKLGLITVDGVVSYEQRIYGHLVLDYNFYDGYINIDKVKGNKAQLTIYYGKETLKVFDKNLKTLPFPVEIVATDLPAHAKSLLDKSWPETSHNFIKVFREDIKTESNYALFENYLNNYIDNGGTWSFPVNTNDMIDGELTAVNRNIMVPNIYLMELLRVGFKTEGLDIKGDFVDDLINQKIVIVPENFMEQFAVSQFSKYSFSSYTLQETINGQTISVYRKEHTPTNTGSFTLKMNINFSDALAKYFSLTVKQNGITLYDANSRNTSVIINKTLDITIINTNVFYDIEVEMKLTQQLANISTFNSFTYEYKEGSLNVFPVNYTLSDYLPDMKFREVINRLRSWKNLKFDYSGNAVYIDYLENHFQNMVFKDKSHLETPEPERTLNTNNLFKLTYPDGQTVLINKEGQTYNENDYIESEITTIDIEVLPLPIKERNGIVTAFYPKDTEKLMLAIYNGTVANDNIAVDHYNNEKLNLETVAEKCWKQWLKFRANAETVEDEFYLHFSDKFDIEEAIFKYNQRLLPVGLRKSRVNDEEYKVTLTCESL